MIAPANPPRLLLASLALLCLAAPFVGHAPNRLLSGVPVAAPAPLVLACPAFLLAMLALPRQTGRLHASALVAATLGLLVTAIEAGAAARLLALHSPPAARTLLGPGFWGLVFAFSLAIVDAVQRLRAPPAAILAITFVLAALLGTLAATGQFDALSLAQEAAAHRAEFATDLARHILLVAATVAAALALGVPLGIAIQRRPRWRGPVFAILNIVQTLPSVALFGLLIAPLAAIGLSGIGLVPALIALVLYALLPVTRQMVAGLDGVDAAVLEAASGMGLAPAQILTRVALPLAAPALIAGLRIVIVQTIGLAVVAALIGAGGLGDFVFQGLGQYAVDLVLLGALPAIALALAADLLLRLAAARFQPGRA